jgi:replication-associated recombination protein RarA
VDQDYLGVDREYYRPTTEGFEAKMKERLDRLRKSRKKGSPGQKKETRDE